MFICWISRRWSSTHLQTESYVSGTSLSFLDFCSHYYCTKSQVELQATCHGDRDKFVLSTGVGTVYPWAMFLQDIPGTQCSLSQPKRRSLKGEKLWSWIDICPSDSLLRRSIYDRRQGKGWSWRTAMADPGEGPGGPAPGILRSKLSAPLSQGLDDRPSPPPPTPTCMWRSGSATGLLSLFSQHF